EAGVGGPVACARAGAAGACPGSGADCRHERCDQAGPAAAGAAAVTVGVDRAGAGGGDGRDHADGAAGRGPAAAAGLPGADLGGARRWVPAGGGPGAAAAAGELERGGRGGGGAAAGGVLGHRGPGRGGAAGPGGRGQEPPRAGPGRGPRTQGRDGWQRPCHAGRPVGAVSGAMGVITRAAPGARSEVLMSLASAVRDGVRVRVDYERADGERFERRLEPYRVLSVEGRWYLFAWDLAREDWRTFRLDRMHEVHASTFTFTPRPTPDIEQTVRESLTVGVYTHAATVRILARAEQVAALVPARAGTITADGQDTCILRAG